MAPSPPVYSHSRVLLPRTPTPSPLHPSLLPLFVCHMFLMPCRDYLSSDAALVETGREVLSRILLRDDDSEGGPADMGAGAAARRCVPLGAGVLMHGFQALCGWIRGVAAGTVRESEGRVCCRVCPSAFARVLLLLRHPSEGRCKLLARASLHPFAARLSSACTGLTTLRGCCCWW